MQDFAYANFRPNSKVGDFFRIRLRLLSVKNFDLWILVRFLPFFAKNIDFITLLLVRDNFFSGLNRKDS